MVKRIPRGHKGGGQGGRLLEAQRRGLARNVARVAHDVGAKAVGADRDDFVTDPQAPDATADALDDPGAFHAERGFRESAGRLEHVGEIHADRADPDLDLAAPDLGALEGKQHDAVGLPRDGDLEPLRSRVGGGASAPGEPADHIFGDAGLVGEDQPVASVVGGFGSGRFRQLGTVNQSSIAARLRGGRSASTAETWGAPTSGSTQ